MTRHEHARTHRDLWAFGASDRFAVFVFAAFAGALAGMQLLVLPLWRWSVGKGVLIEVPVADVGPGALPMVGSTVTVSASGAGTTERLITLAPGLVTLALVLAGLWCIVRIVAAIVGPDQVVGGAVVRRMRWLAGGLLAAPVLLSVLSSVASTVVADRLGLDAPGVGLDIDPAWIIAGLLCAAVAQAFANADRWREDVDGLV
ncbi:hypothetical protein ACHAAC_05695 [Aeromicrobium sp. CF4.19]|uniref:hypothetical protein n=1 Tax=Aeromicrobium sp. CF4.19 TaxID=3373082 RepID=UPI003EE72C4B